jgi:hypothetical protein
MRQPLKQIQGRNNNPNGSKLKVSLAIRKEKA